MPLTVPPLVQAVYAEWNTPPAGVTGIITPDTYYGLDQIELEGDALVSALARMGLEASTEPGIFKAIIPTVIATALQLTPDNSPGGACRVYLATPDYPSNPLVDIANPNTLGADSAGSLLFSRTFAMQIGDEFKLAQHCTNGSDTPISYAALSIIRQA